jgi:aminopeptidase N
VTFERKSRMQMPIDFRVIAKDGKSYDYHIPNNWFIKKTDATVLEKWHGWDLIHPTYTAHLDIPSGIEEVIIDPSGRLADAYMPDNNSKCNTTFSFDHKLYQYPDWTNYEIKYRPDVWWNNYDGVKVGLNLNGGYMRHHHLFDASVWFNTGALQKDSIANANDYDYYSYRVNYNTNLDEIALNTRLNVRSQFLAGLHTNKLSLVKSDSKGNNKLTVDFLSMYRTNDNYLINNGWDLRTMNNRIDLNLEHKYKYSYGKGTLNLKLQSSALGSAYDYNKLILSAKNNNKVEKLKINTRAYFQLGTGNNWAEESKLSLAGANNEEMMGSKFTRAEGIVSADFMGYDYTTNYFHAAGGLNLRGYSGYLAPEFNENGTVASYNYNGRSGAAFNTEIDFTAYLPYSIRKNNIASYLFADAGIISSENLTKENYKEVFSDVRADAGVGFTYTLRNFGPLEAVKPLVIRFDMPLFLNRPPASDEDFFQFRWLIGINRAL